MIFVDTNFLLRFLLDDVPSQSQHVKHLFKQAALGKAKLFTSTVAIMETQWALSSFYELNRGKISEHIYNLISLDFIELKEREIIYTALDTFTSSNLEFIDCYHLAFAKNRGASQFKTFDKRLARQFAK